MERENFLEEEIEESDEDSLMSQIIHEIGRSGTLKRKERKSIRKIFDYETEPTKTIDDSDSGTISEIESIQDEDMEEIQEPKFESLDNLLIQQDQEKFEKELPPPIPEKSEDTILKEFIPIPEEPSQISEASTVLGPGPVQPTNSSQITKPSDSSSVDSNVKLINPESSEEELLIAHKIEIDSLNEEELIDEASSDSRSAKVKGCACVRRRKIDWPTFKNPLPRWKAKITNFIENHRRQKTPSHHSSTFEQLDVSIEQNL
ncbi:Oidioi.mRNA.OKI2018_I69.PAR.g8669.t1.cds [Oikopleura dioica]|uniref:Oidioi.mRNA.OKI2018_I69.PAR.g8669.t1.cds n=1 Tax=Oikopleura dioica TaxID=34765 RepID=A0ABN7RI64_OIKDI|nr:Oidioi.mRNA.OKI2018_I69.PAR.g8669.t1.cds [Oikopleura dioica]